MMRTQTICIHAPTLSNTINTGRHVMRERYASTKGHGENLTEPLYLLDFIELVPVVGLEPTRLFKVPGF